MNRAIITLMSLGVPVGQYADSSVEGLLGDYVQEGRSALKTISKFVANGFKDKKCYQCGCCCKEMPCKYGKWDDAAHQCLYLETAEKFAQYNTYRCAKYAEIAKTEAHQKYPMFGNGCGRPLLNPDRNKIKQLKTGRELPEINDVDKNH